MHSHVTLVIPYLLLYCSCPVPLFWLSPWWLILYGYLLSYGKVRVLMCVCQEPLLYSSLGSSNSLLYFFNLQPPFIYHLWFGVSLWQKIITVHLQCFGHLLHAQPFFWSQVICDHFFACLIITSAHSLELRWYAELTCCQTLNFVRKVCISALQSVCLLLVAIS